jgi:signal transduction histidine kinase/CheY-like chemotaxis protein
VHEEILGQLPSRADEVRDWWRERLHPEDAGRVVKELEVAMADPTVARWSAEYRIRGVDGEYRFIQDRALISRGDDHRLKRIVGAVRDLTSLQREQEEREKMGRKLLKAQKLESLGVLAGGIAHDFNNLLTSILGNVNLAQLELPSSSLVYPYLDDVEKASIRAADLCKQMLAYSGKGRFVVKRVGLSGLVEEMMQLLQVSISKQAVLKYSLSKNLPAVAADPTQVRQIVMNLAINASEAVGEKSGIVSIATGLMRADREYLKGTYLSPNIPEGDYVYLEVSDSGRGMDKATLERIFDPFFTTKFTGRGLGLAAVLGIVRGHRGALRVYSELGKGATFKLLLPVAEGTAEGSGIGLMPLAKTRGEGVILVVDDEETVRTTSARMLETAGYTVEIATDGCEGLEAFRRSSDKIRLVLLDLTMPQMDGVETFREIRRVRPDACVVLMSGYNELEAVQRFTGKGLAGFIQKPFQIQSLLGKIREVLEADRE